MTSLVGRADVGPPDATRHVAAARAVATEVAAPHANDVDRRAAFPAETIAALARARLLAAVVPVDCVLDRLQLAWWESGDCRVVHEWRLGG